MIFFVPVSPLVQYADDSCEILFRSQGNLNRNWRASEYLGNRFERPLEAGVIPIHLVKDDDTRQPEFIAKFPHLFRLNLYTRDRIDYDQGRVRHPQSQFGLGKERAISRRIQDVDLRLPPLHTCHGGGNRHLPRDLLFVVICRRAAIIHSSHPLACSPRVQHCRYQRGLPRVAVPHNRHIPDVCAFIGFHEFAPGKIKTYRSMKHGRSCPCWTDNLNCRSETTAGL